MNARYKAIQILVECSDTIAVLLDIGDAYILLVVSYELRDGADKAEKEEAIRGRIEKIIEVRRKADKEVRGAISILIYTD